MSDGVRVAGLRASGPLWSGLSGRAKGVAAVLLSLGFGWTWISAAAEPQSPAPSVQTFEGRGIYYIEGRVRSPLGGTTARSPFATNRLAIDDAHTRAQVDRDAHRIVIRNEHAYGLNELVACLLLMGRGTTESGRSVPAAVHLKIHKTHNRFVTSLHPHPTVRDKLASAEFEPFDVVLANGKTEVNVLTNALAVEAVRDPQLSARLANLFMQVTDQLEGQQLETDRKGAPLVDLLFGFGGEQANLKLARVRLLSNDPANGELIRAGSAEAMLERGNWEFQIDSLTPYIPRWQFQRDFFLFGLEGLGAIEKISKRGLLKGEKLVVGIRDGTGYISVGDERSEIANPAEVARSYLEFHFVGGVVAQQVAELPARLK